MATAPFPFVYSGPPASPYPPPAVFPAPPFRYSNFTSAAAPPTQPFGSFPHGATYPYPTPASAYMPDHHPVQAAPQIDAYPSPFSPGGSSTFPYDATCYCLTCVAPQIPTHVGPNQLPTAPTPIRSEPEEYGSAAARYDPLLSSSPHAARDATGALSGPLLDCIPDDVFDGTHEKKLIHKHKATGILSMASSGSNHRSVTQQAPTQSSFDSLQAAILKLSALVPQLALSMGMQTTEAPAADSPPRAVTAPSTSLASSAAASSSAPTHGALQVFTEMPQQYGLNNLNRQSIILADGTKRSYFTLPADYPLEQDTPPMSPLAADNVGVTAQLSVTAQAAGLATVHCSKTNNIADYEPMLVHHLKLPMTAQDSSNVCKQMPVYDLYEDDNSCPNCMDEQLLRYFSKAPETEQTSADVLDYTFEQQQQESAPLPKCFSKQIFSPERPTDGVFSSTNEKKPDNELIFLCVNKATDDAFCEDVTALTSIHVPHLFVGESIQCSMSNNKIELTSLPHSEPCGKHGKAQVHNHQWNLLLTERRDKWDPGIRKTIMDIPHVVKWSSLILVSSHLSMLCDPASSLPPISTKTQKPDQALRPAIHATLVDNFEKLHGHEKVAPLAGSSVTGFSGYKCFSIWIQNNIYVCWKSEFGMTTYISWDPGVLHILDTYTVHNQVQFAQMIAEHLFFRLTTCKQYIAPNDINSVFHATCFTLQKAPHLTQDNYLCSLYCNNVLKTSYVWDPGVKISLYSWFNILTVWSETDKPLSCTHIPDSAAWRNKSVGSGTSYIWDPGTVLWYTFVSLVLATVRDTLYAYYLPVRHSNGRSIYYPENIMCYLTVNSVLEEKEMLNGPRTRFWSSKLHPMQCTDYYQTCNSLSFPHYSHQDLTFCEIALWLIHFSLLDRDEIILKDNCQ